MLKHLHKNTYPPMSNSSTTRLYGGIDRPSIQSQISNCAIPIAFVGILGLLRFAQEGFSLDPYAIALFGFAALLHWKCRG